MSLNENILKYRLENIQKNSNIVILAACSIFLPYQLAGIILVTLALYIIINKKTRRITFLHKNYKTLFIFFTFILIVPSIYQNWLGLIVGIAVILAITLGLFFRSVMTTRLFEKILTLICVLSLTSTSYAICERFLLPFLTRGNTTSRMSSVFFYPNYFGTVIATVIIICAYKILTKQGQAGFYCFIAFTNLISMYLCGSMFAWVEVFVGIGVLLFILKKQKVLMLWVLGAVVMCFAILVLNIEIIPRISDAEATTKLRLEIWKYAFEQIKNSPFIGHGLMSYIFVNDCYTKPHAHSIYFEMIVNFGVVGTVIFLDFSIKYYLAIWKVCFKEKKTKITSLILAITAAALVHGIADITLFWIQTLYWRVVGHMKNL